MSSADARMIVRVTTVLALAACWWAFRRRARGVRGDDADDGPYPPSPPRAHEFAEFAEFAAVSPSHHEAYRRARWRFVETFALVFQYGNVLGAQLVRQMFGARDEALTALGEMRMRLPNDLDAELRFVRTVDAVDAEMMAGIDDARRATGVAIHPGPLSAATDATRAIDDVLDR